MEGIENKSDIKLINDKDNTLNDIDKKNITNILPTKEAETKKDTSEKLETNTNNKENSQNLETKNNNSINNENKKEDEKEIKKENDNIKEENKMKIEKEEIKVDIKENNILKENKLINNSNNIKEGNIGKENKINNNDNRIINDNKYFLKKKEEYKKEKYRTRSSLIKKTGCRNVNNYKIIEEHIGEGTFGMVFKAEYVGNMDYAKKFGIPKIVALKKIKMEDSKEGFPITALREIMIMKKCHHENLLKILEIVTSKSLIKNQKKQNVFIVFEYMEHDLSGLGLAKIRFDLPQIKYIMYEILKGVQYLHKNNIIHRDIKCANILINNKGEVKIGDFGLARNISPNHTKKYTYKVVTLWFRAPELLFGETLYGPGIDVWSCGCVFGELLTGTCPFQGKDEESLMTKICEKCGTPNESTWPGVTKLPLYNKLCPRINFPNSFKQHFSELDDITFDLFSKMLELNPKKRINIDDALNHPFFHSHTPSMCTAKEMPKLEKEYHEFEYSRQRKKMKEERQNIAKRDYLSKQNANYNSSKVFYNNANSNNKDYYYLGKKHYLDRNNNYNSWNKNK